MSLVTPPFISSYVQVNEAVAGPDGGDPKYSVQMIFPAGTDLSALEAAQDEAVKAKWGSKRPRNLRMALRSGEEKDGDVYEGATFMNCRSNRKPGLVDKNRDPILDPSEYYSGCIARATVVAFAYDMKGNKGVGFGLNNIQMLKEGERLDGGVSAERESGFDDADDLDLDNL